MNDVVVGMGEALWDVLPEGKKIGGAPANFAYHVSQFGLDSCAVSAIGDDALGIELLENFNKKGVKHLIETVPYPTGTVQVEIDQAGKRKKKTWRGTISPTLPNSNRSPNALVPYASAHSHSVMSCHEAP